LRDSGHSAPSPSVRTRQNTRAPGAAAGDLLDFLDAVDGEEVHAELVGAGDVAFFLDGVAIGNAGRVAPASSAISISATEAQSKDWSRGPPAGAGFPARDWLSRHRRCGCPAGPS
jgi:hypothetical protein